jgi:hypothetical protein
MDIQVDGFSGKVLGAYLVISDDKVPDGTLDAGREEGTEGFMGVPTWACEQGFEDHVDRKVERFTLGGEFLSLSDELRVVTKL